MPAFQGNLLVRNGRLIDPASRTDAILDVRIERGRVTEIGPDLIPSPEIPLFEAAGLVVAPGFIDVHVHLREPGFEHKETIATGTAAAAAGGICALACMPNTVPPPDTVDHLHQLLARLERTAAVRVYPIACITRRRAGRQLAPLEELAAAGAVAFSDDGDPVESAALMRQALEIAGRLGRPLSPHEELKELSGQGAMHQGEVATRLGYQGMPAASEEQLIARDLELVRQTGGPLHLAHLSTAGGLEQVRRAKADGLPVTCEVTPHHFSLTDEAVIRQGTNAKMNPPLRTAADVQALQVGLQDNTIDLIATDHAPHAAAEKALPFARAPFGIVGLETALGITLTWLVEPGIVELATAIEKWTWAPARIFKLPGGRLCPGALGDVTIIDPEYEWTVDPERFRSRSRNTPFGGYRLRGKAVATVIGGVLVFYEPTG